MFWNPTRPPDVLVIDDWEDGDQIGWTGTADTSVTSTAIKGSYSLEHSQTTFTRITSGTGVSNPLANYPAKGAEVSWLVDTDGFGDNFWLVAFGSGDGTSTSNYNIQAQLLQNGELAVREEVAGSESTLAITSAGLSSNTIYEITLQWHDGTDNTDNTATATAYNWDTSNQERGTKIDSINAAVDSSHDTNNNGAVEMWFPSNSSQAERIDRHVILNGKTV